MKKRTSKANSLTKEETLIDIIVFSKEGTQCRFINADARIFYANKNK